MSLALRNLLFTLVIPGSVAVVFPRMILSRFAPVPTSTSSPALVLIILGASLYFWCLWLFAARGRGTPGPWDAPRNFVATGPYRWVRNPMYISVLTAVLGQAWLFSSPPLLIYALVVAFAFHLVVVTYEEPTLSHMFGQTYATYLRTAPRWIPRAPRR